MAILHDDYPKLDWILYLAILAGGIYGVSRLLDKPIPLVDGLANSEPSAEISIARDSFPIYNLALSEAVTAELEAAEISSEFLDVPSQRERLDFTTAGHNFALTTLDKALKYTKGGKIIALIDVTTGGDCVLTSPALGGSFSALEGSDPVVAYTEDSPSEYLWDVTRTLAEVRDGRGNNRPVSDSKDAYSLLASGQADVAVMWQPNCSEGQEFNTLISTQQLRGNIIDVLVVSEAYASENPDKVQTYLNAYYGALFNALRSGDLSTLDAAVEGDFEEFRVKAFNSITANDWLVGGNFRRAMDLTKSITNTSNEVEFDPSFMEAAIRDHNTLYSSEKLNDFQKAQLGNLRRSPNAQPLRIDYDKFRKVTTVNLANLRSLSSDLRSQYPLGDYLFRVVVTHPSAKTARERANFNVITLHDLGVTNPIDFETKSGSQSTVLEVWEDVGQ